MGSHRERVSLALARSFYLPNLIGFCVGTHTSSKLAYTPGVDHRMQDPMATELAYRTLLQRFGFEKRTHCELATERSSEPRVHVLQCVRNVQSSVKELSRTIPLRVYIGRYYEYDEIRCEARTKRSPQTRSCVGWNALGRPPVGSSDRKHSFIS